MQLRQAVAADAPAIRDLTRAAYTKWIAVIGREPKPMLADYAEALRKHRIDLLYLDDGLAALIETIPEPAHLLIENVAVAPAFQGQGLGRKLMATAIGYLGERYGDAPQWLGVWCQNLRAQALYRSYGFEKIGEYEFPVGETRDHEFIFCRFP